MIQREGGSGDGGEERELVGCCGEGGWWFGIIVGSIKEKETEKTGFEFKNSTLTKEGKEVSCTTSSFGLGKGRPALNALKRVTRSSASNVSCEVFLSAAPTLHPN
jgi:hypothetical protein